MAATRAHHTEQSSKEQQDFIKDTRTISVEVATEADIQFGEDVDTSEEAFVMLKDQVKRRKCRKRQNNYV